MFPRPHRTVQVIYCLLYSSSFLFCYFKAYLLLCFLDFYSTNVINKFYFVFSLYQIYCFFCLSIQYYNVVGYISFLYAIFLYITFHYVTLHGICTVLFCIVLCWISIGTSISTGSSMTLSISIRICSSKV